jgi:hypothetical protein
MLMDKEMHHADEKCVSHIAIIPHQHPLEWRTIPAALVTFTVLQ